jgi:magnesium-transporting ATPase (P-type)
MTLRILRFMPFSHELRRTSVVVEMEGQVFCFTKGAPQTVLERCRDGQGYDARLFQRSGFRALSTSFGLVDGYSPQMSQEDLEADHTLLGSVAIADTLQQDAQVSIALLRQAGIQVWVATGDDLLNTMVTCERLRIVTGRVVRLTAENMFRDFDARARDATGPYSVFVHCTDGNRVRRFLQAGENVQALLNAETAVFYQASPATKAAVVEALRGFGRKVMGVGDGANDSELLRRADVGIGLVSQQAAVFSGCDFALPSFHALCRLILVHGHLSLHRSVIAVHFSFYKGMLLAMIQAWYQIWTGGTGMSFFDPFSLASYNLVWTSVPMIAIIFERDISDNFLMRLSKLYHELKNPLTIFPNASWFGAALYQSISTVFITYFLTGEEFVHPASGKCMGVEFLSINVYVGILILVNTFMFFQISMMTYYSLLCTFGTLLAIVAFMCLLQSSDTPMGVSVWFEFYEESFTTWQSLLLIATIACAGAFPTYLAMMLWNERYHMQVMQVTETEAICLSTDEPVFYSPPRQEDYRLGTVAVAPSDAREETEFVLPSPHAR